MSTNLEIIEKLEDLMDQLLQELYDGSYQDKIAHFKKLTLTGAMLAGEQYEYASLVSDRSSSPDVHFAFNIESDYFDYLPPIVWFMYPRPQVKSRAVAHLDRIKVTAGKATAGRKKQDQYNFIPSNEDYLAKEVAFREMLIRNDSLKDMTVR